MTKSLLFSLRFTFYMLFYACNNVYLFLVLPMDIDSLNCIKTNENLPKKVLRYNLKIYYVGFSLIYCCFNFSVVEVTNVKDQSGKCTKLSNLVDNEQDFYLSIQPNVSLFFIDYSCHLANIKFYVLNTKNILFLLLTNLENSSRSNDARSLKCKY